MDEKVLRMLAESQARQTQLMEYLAKKEGMATKDPASIGTFTGIYQPGGIFSVPGTDRDVFTAHIRPQGISSVLPMFPGNEDNPRYATITGFTATSGARPVNPCDDSPAGFMKGCYLTARFGRVSYDTQTIEWDKVRRKTNRGVFDDLVLHGRVLGLTDLTPQNLNEGQMLNIITMSEMIGAAVQLERDLVVQDWQGSPAVATAGGGYIQYPGLDLQIATGQVDAETNTLCPALDSDVKDFAYNLVGGAGNSIVEYVGTMEWFLRNNARKMGLEPATWQIAMRPELWQILSEVWPCVYNTNRCSGAMQGANSRLVLQGDEMVATRDQMRQSMTIDINGRPYPVVVDDGIFEHTNANNANVPPGSFASSLYFVPLTVTNGFPVTYRQHVDYRLGAADVALLPNGIVDFWTDRGVYSWAYDGEKWCYKLSVKTEQRIVLRTPQLAGKVQNILYDPLQHLRSPFADNPYFEDGGVSVRARGTDYAVWLSGAAPRP
jgi:hypothetical protein